jgi:hypothetical protein
MKLLPVLLLALVSPMAHAAAVHSCEGLDSNENLVGNVRSFSQGQIRVAHISTEEPAAAPDHVLVFVASEEIGSTCYAVSASKDGLGFAGVDMPRLQPEYSAKNGLSLTIPVSKYDQDKGSVPGGKITITVDRRLGEGKAVSVK